MAWVKLDDAIFRNRKFAPRTKDAKLLYIAGLAYSNDQLSDGRLNAEDFALVGAMVGVRWRRAVAELEDAGLLDAVADGWYIHDFLVYQECAAKVIERREADRKRKGFRGDSGGNPPGGRTDSKNPPPTPTPGPKELKSPSDLGNAPPDGAQETASIKGDRLLPRLVGAVKLRGSEAETEARTVLRVARQHLDDKLIDEGIGFLCGLEKRADRPVYLLTLLNDWSAKRGLQIPEMRLHPKRGAA